MQPNGTSSAIFYTSRFEGRATLHDNVIIVSQAAHIHVILALNYIQQIYLPNLGGYHLKHRS